MFVHSSRLGYTARVSEPDRKLAGLVLGRLREARPALPAPARTFAQALAESDGGRKDMLLAVAADELGRLELVGAMASMLNRGGTGAADGAAHAELLADIAQGGESRTAGLLCGAAPAGLAAVWTAPPHIDEVVHPPSALLSGVAAKAQALRLYRGLMAATDDVDLRDALGFLMEREAAHRTSFRKALHAIEPGLPPQATAGGL